MEPLEDILPEKDIIRVHGCSNFGSLTPRYIVNEGVLKSAFGYHHGSTATAILREHGLIKKNGCLAKKGFDYLRVLHVYDIAKGGL